MDVPKQLMASNSAASCLKKLPFTSSERELIVALVRERPIIEDKRTNAKNIELKKQAWEELTVDFNTQPYITKRNSQQLKRCWENITTLRKKELSQDSFYMNRTGGGPPQGGSTGSDNVVDVICPFINLTAPGVIDSNSIESDLKKMRDEKTYLEKDVELLDNTLSLDEPNRKILKRKLEDVVHSTNNYEDNTLQVIGNEYEIVSLQSLRKNETLNTPVAGNKKFMSEVEARLKRCTMNILNMQQDQALHELRLQREKILIEREKKQLRV